jgi:hypothetical protein
MNKFICAVRDLLFEFLSSKLFMETVLKTYTNKKYVEIPNVSWFLLTYITSSSEKNVFT